MAEPGNRNLASAEPIRRTEDRDVATGKRFRTDGQQELMADLKSMVNNPKRSDVLFRCSDGGGVSASRWLLANRCNVFEGMFRNGTVESNSPEVSLPTISSRVMLSVVDFLYTGTIESYPLLDWKMGWEMARAGEFFMIHLLKEIAEDYLESMISKACLDEQQDVLMRMVSVALEFPEVEFSCVKEAKKSMLRDLVSRIHIDWFAPSYSCELSRTAVDYILHKSRKRLDQGKLTPSMEEYCILRNIVLWHVHEVTKDEKVQQIATKLLPRRESLWRKMLELPDVDDFFSAVSGSSPLDSPDSTSVLNSSLGIQLQKDSLDQMLQRYVNLTCIPASLLLTIIHPLQIFSPDRLFRDVLRGALCRRVQTEMFESDFRWHNLGTSSISIGAGGYISCKNVNRESTNTAAVYIPGPTTSGDSFAWQFIIRQDDADSIDLGFICLADKDHDKVNDLVKKTLQDLSESRIVRIDAKKKMVSWTNDKPKSDLNNWHNSKLDLDTNLKVVFRVFHSPEEECLSDDCWVFIGNRILEISFDDLSHGLTYFPAVCFNGCLSGEVKFELLDGFEYY